MAWIANCKITNNTDYSIILDNGEVDPQSEYTWSSEAERNVCFFKLTNDGVIDVQGNFSFGAQSGVHVDRGWMQEQTISMTAEAGEKVWTQTANGGHTLLAYNEFEEGGDIHLTFNSQE
jgi:outer membrane protease